MNEVQANGGIDDINARHNRKIEGYKTQMLNMNESYVMQPPVILTDCKKVRE